jgi:hypothetical protein
MAQVHTCAAALVLALMCCALLAPAPVCAYSNGAGSCSYPNSAMGNANDQSGNGGFSISVRPPPALPLATPSSFCVLLLVCERCGVYVCVRVQVTDPLSQAASTYVPDTVYTITFGRGSVFTGWLLQTVRGAPGTKGSDCTCSPLCSRLTIFGWSFVRV